LKQGEILVAHPPDRCALDQVKVRHDLRPGDIGSVVSLHGILYAREYNYDHTFEAYVAAGTAEFAQSFDPHWDRLWIAEAGGGAIGCIAIVRRPQSEAQLRWFLIHPNWRGLGLGRILLREALQFCEECAYRAVFLWTVSGLAAATHLYESAGFEKTEEKASKLWGHTVTEERYVLQLRPPGQPNLQKS
jgi:N-acetylglutamate synthase-like GNAT family acetyltransferase